MHPLAGTEHKHGGRTIQDISRGHLLQVILGLRKLRALGVTTCIIKTDSKIVAGQIEKDYAAKDPALMQYLAAIRSLERQFKGFTL